MVLALYRVHDRYNLSEITVSTYQAVSGAGNKALKEYGAQLNGSNEVSVFAKPIAHNVIPLIGTLKDDLSEEEWKNDKRDEKDTQFYDQLMCFQQQFAFL